MSNSIFNKPTKTVEASIVSSPVKYDQTSLTVPSPTVVKGVTRPEKGLFQMEGAEIVTWASEPQKELSNCFDQLLSEITKGSSPILFELFNQIKKGINETNLPELEQKIRASQGKAWWHVLVDALGLSSQVKRLQAGNTAIEGMLTTKSKSLLDLIRSMESKMQTEVSSLIKDTTRLSSLEKAYRGSIGTFKEYYEQGTLMLTDAKEELKSAVPAADADPLVVQDYKEKEQKAQFFESRLLVIQNALTEAPAQLESIRLGKGASFATLGETTNASLSEFNTIKSQLIQLAVSVQIKTVQTINSERRNLRDSLSNYGTQMLGEVAVNAAKAQGTNRLEDAQRLLTYAQNLSSIGDKVVAEMKENDKRFSDAKTKLLEVQQLLKKH